MNFIQPSRLKPGDKVAIISPSAGLPHIYPWVYEQGLKRIEEVFQLTPVEFPTARQSPDYLSKNPKARADDINAAFADSAIKAVISTVGGNDQIRILPYLDKAIISANSKIFMGYSDCTNLHLFLWNLGIISYYGGSVMTQFAMGGGMHDYTVNSIKKALFSGSMGEVHAAPEYSDADLDWADPQNLTKKRPMYQSNGWHWLNPQDGIIQGQLWGGCLEVLDLHLSVRRYLPNFNNVGELVLYLETSEELPTEGFVYRFLAALAELGILQKFKAILTGYPKAQFCDMLPPEGREAYIVNQQNAVVNALKDYELKIPVIFNMNFGHTDPQIIIPSGGSVTINCTTKTIQVI